jgi:hypothetical protein
MNNVLISVTYFSDLHWMCSGEGGRGAGGKNYDGSGTEDGWQAEAHLMMKFNSICSDKCRYSFTRINPGYTITTLHVSTLLVIVRIQYVRPGETATAVFVVNFDQYISEFRVVQQEQV